VAQGVGPEFKSQHHKKERTSENPDKLEGRVLENPLTGALE
jgi:hypothetical protein